MKRITSALFVLLIATSSLFSQNAITLEQGSTKAYYYRLTNKEAEKLYPKEWVKLKKSFFHTLADSCDVKETEKKKLKPGQN